MTNFRRFLISAVFLLVFLAGCNFRSGHKVYAYAEQLLAKGELTEASEVAQKILKSNNLSPLEKSKVDSILEMIYRIRQDFTLSDREVLLKLGKYHPNMDSSDLLQLERMNKLDCRILDGEKRYFKNCVANVFRLDTAYARMQVVINGEVADSFPAFKLSHTAAVLNETKVSGQPVKPVRMKLSYTIRVRANAVPEGDTIRCWMPYPRENHERQKDILLISTDPVKNRLSPASDLQRSIYLEKVAVANQPVLFHTEMEFTSSGQSYQLTPEMIRPYQKESALYKENTAERPPQIVFNDRIKSLTKNILKGETNPLLQVKKIYQWINDSVTWASALEYSMMPDIPGFVMEHRHGDCGMQTLLFMTLARSQGIPVKWQSGWMLHPGEVNLHDWCEVWYEGIGWVPLDQSFGLQNSPDPRIRDFYITGIDSYRLIVNDDFSKPFTPSKQYFRSEPYDFQRGELEWKGGNLYFNKWSWHMDVTYEK
jgi:hypothetical protein